MWVFSLVITQRMFSILSLTLPYKDIVNAQVVIGRPINVPLESSFQSPSNSFNITILEPAMSLVQDHVDYDFTIIDNNSGETIYKESAETNQPFLHAFEGILPIPNEFANPRDHTIRIDSAGINFIPILPESFTFPIKMFENGNA